MRHRLAAFDLDIICLRDLESEGKTLPQVTENGATPLDNARIKALAYYEAFGMPVFSCDSGLYIEGIPAEEQPGTHVRTIQGKYCTDEEMLLYYTGLARKYGNPRARYRNAICLVQDADHVYPAMEESMASQPFWLTDHPHKDGIREKGFPLDCISVDVQTGKYFYDLEDEHVDQVAVEDGFLDFFARFCK